MKLTVTYPTYLQKVDNKPAKIEAQAEKEILPRLEGFNTTGVPKHVAFAYIDSATFQPYDDHVDDDNPYLEGEMTAIIHIRSAMSYSVFRLVIKELCTIEDLQIDTLQ